jgi:type II secretory pathway component GspD/PulD (secretin)
VGNTPVIDSLELNQNIRVKKCSMVTRLKEKHFSYPYTSDPTPQRKYDFELLESSLKESLLELSIKSGVPIIIDENVTGIVSVNVKGKSFLQIMELFLSVGPFDYKYEKGYFLVGMVDVSTNSWWNIAYHYNFIINYTRPSNIVKQIHPRFHMFLSANDSKNILSVNAPRKLLREIGHQLYELDLKRRQIILNISISEVSRRNKMQIGKLADYSNGPGNLTEIVNLPNSKLNDVLSYMNYLKSNGDLEVKANPRLVAQEGKSVVFDSMVKDYSLLSSGNSSTNRAYVETGIQLKITPRISQQNDIILDIQNLQLGDIVDSKIYEHNIKTTIRVKQGESIIIGGMLTKKSRMQVTKVPVLGDIPLVGWFFKDKRSYIEDTEILFIIRPEVRCDA